MRKNIGVWIFVSILSGVFAGQAYGDLFKKAEKKPASAAIDADKTAEIKDAPASFVAADPRVQQIPGKLQGIESQQKSLKVLEARLVSEQKQLDDMQKDFALNFKVDLEKLKAGKVRWDEKKKTLVTD